MIMIVIFLTTTTTTIIVMITMIIIKFILIIVIKLILITVLPTEEKVHFSVQISIRMKLHPELKLRCISCWDCMMHKHHSENKRKHWNAAKLCGTASVPCSMFPFPRSQPKHKAMRHMNLCPVPAFFKHRIGPWGSETSKYIFVRVEIVGRFYIFFWWMLNFL